MAPFCKYLFWTRHCCPEMTLVTFFLSTENLNTLITICQLLRLLTVLGTGHASVGGGNRLIEEPIFRDIVSIDARIWCLFYVIFSSWNEWQQETDIDEHTTKKREKKKTGSKLEIRSFEFLQNWNKSSFILSFKTFCNIECFRKQPETKILRENVFEKHDEKINCNMLLPLLQTCHPVWHPFTLLLTSLLP